MKLPAADRPPFHWGSRIAPLLFAHLLCFTHTAPHSPLCCNSTLGGQVGLCSATRRDCLSKFANLLLYLSFYLCIHPSVVLSFTLRQIQAQCFVSSVQTMPTASHSQLQNLSFPECIAFLSKVSASSTDKHISLIFKARLARLKYQKTPGREEKSLLFSPTIHPSPHLTRSQYVTVWFPVPVFH